MIVLSMNRSNQLSRPASKVFPKVVVRLGWVSLFTDAATEMIYPLLPAFLRALTGSVRGGAAWLGVMEGVAESVSAAVKWWAGGLSDRAGSRKPFVVAGYAIASLVRPLLALAATPLQVVLVRATDRVGKGVRSAPRDALLAAAVDARARGAAFGFHQMMDNIGAVIGPLLAFALARGLGWPLRWIFAAAIVPGLVALATVIRVPEETSGAPKGAASFGGEPRPEAAPSASPALPPAARRYLAIVAIFTLGASADSFLLLRMIDVGLPEAWLPLAWLSLSASKAATNLPGGRLSDRFGRRPTLVAAWVVYASAYALFPLTSSLAGSWALLVAYGAYYGLAEGGEKAIVADLAGPSARGRAYGALHAVTGAAVLPANALFGALYARHVGWAFGASAACALIAAAALAVARWPGERGEREAPDDRDEETAAA